MKVNVEWQQQQEPTATVVCSHMNFEGVIVDTRFCVHEGLAVCVLVCWWSQQLQEFLSFLTHIHAGAPPAKAQHQHTKGVPAAEAESDHLIRTSFKS